MLLGLLFFFSVLALSGTVGVFEQDTRLKRFAENEVKANLDAIRRAIDLYRYQVNPGRSPTDPLEQALSGNSAEEVVRLLANAGFLRGRVATGTYQWRLVGNLLKNPSFEEDSGRMYAPVAGWQGNFTSNDGVPDGWEAMADGVEQRVELLPGTYVFSFWAKTMMPSSRVTARIWKGGDPVPTEISAQTHSWKRFHTSFTLTVSAVVRIQILQTGMGSGDVAYVDGVMLEPWTPPPDWTGSEPIPSAWTRDISIVSELASAALQSAHFDALVDVSGATSSLRYLFEW